MKRGETPKNKVSLLPKKEESKRGEASLGIIPSGGEVEGV